MSSPKRPLFCIIDASSFIFRAFYAVRPLSNKNGLPTNAIYGFAQMIFKVLEDFRPTYIAVVYDTKYPSFRKELYPEYKAHRGPMPEDLVPQMPYIKKFIETLGLPSFEMPGFEADDLIATLSDQAARKTGEADVCIISSDKDLMQLVEDSVYLFDTMKDQKYTADKVKEKLGVLPPLVADYLGLIGDTSDNIPGVKGIGPKSAVALLEEFGSVEGIYANLDKVKKESQRKMLETNRDNAFLSKTLATVKRDLVLQNDWHLLKCNPHAGEAFLALLEELEFQALAKRVRNLAPAEDKEERTGEIVVENSSDTVKSLKASYQTLDSLNALEKVFQSLASRSVIALDTETTGLSAHSDQIVGFSFCADDKNAYYVPLRHVDDAGARIASQCNPEQALAALQKFIHDKKLVGQNMKFDLNILRAAGVRISAEQIYFDTMIASYMLDPELRHNLDALALKHLNHANIKYSDICGEGKSEIPFASAPIPRATEYAAEDAHVAFLLAQKLQERLHAIPELEKVFREIELPLMRVLAELEWVGVAIDSPLLNKLSEEFAIDLDLLIKRAHELAGGEFNLASPKQLQKILFEDLKLPTQKKTKTGFSTDVDVLEKLAHMHELPRLILEHREIAKLKSTYVDVLPTLVNPKTHRVHASFNQTVAATGRLSSSDPNLQNIPIRTKSGKRIRSAFIASDGFLLLGADYSQIELRILASMSGDAALVEAFRKGQDIHSLTAAQIFSRELSKVSDEERRQAKAVNFGILYGKSAFSLAEDLGIPRGAAASIIERYFARYPTIRAFIDGLKSVAKEKGYAETLFGRRRNIEGIHSQNKVILGMAERMAVNTPIQGTAADLIKIAMIHLFAALEKEKSGAKLILQVHDELVLEVPTSEIDATKALVREHMESAGEGKVHVPINVEMGTAKNWLDI